MKSGLRNFNRPRTQPYKNMYGSDYIAARYCGLAKPPNEVPGIWMHGWCPGKQDLRYPELLFGVSVGELKMEPCWVATKRQEQVLRSKGFAEARAIGLPIIYTAENRPERRQGSLLVMPVHSLSQSRHRWNVESYVETIDALRSHFDEITVCVSAHCWSQGMWIPEFEACGFKVIRGADGGDPWTLQGMADLFHRFEFVTTNGFGSHIPYAASLGAKVSIFGDYVESTAAALSNVPYYQDNPHLLELELENASYNTNFQRFPELFCYPCEAKDLKEWGDSEIGRDNKLSPREMRAIFGWRKVDQVREQTVSYLRKTKVLLPAPIHQKVRAILSRPVAEVTNEYERLKKLPRYVPGRTQLFGRSIQFIDACTYLLMCDELFERQIYRFATRNERPSIIDGGANIGLSTIYFKYLYPNSSVIAFEADPAIFQVLEQNCETFELKDVQLIDKAIWKAETLISFYQEGSLAGRIVEGKAAKKVAVPTCRLRDFLQIERTFLKLDIEGAETEVLQDCADLLKNVEHIFVEHHSFLDCEQNLHLVMSILHEAGFRLFVEPAAPAAQPLFQRTVICGMDVQVNIYGFRI